MGAQHGRDEGGEMATTGGDGAGEAVVPAPVAAAARGRREGEEAARGGGKSTTVSRLIQQARAAGMAVVVVDVEGEYTAIHEPTDDPTMLTLLAERGLAPAGVPADRVHLYHLVGREAADAAHPDRRP